jgi:hypothetical protein
VTSLEFRCYTCGRHEAYQFDAAWGWHWSNRLTWESRQPCKGGLVRGWMPNVPTIAMTTTTTRCDGVVEEVYVCRKTSADPIPDNWDEAWYGEHRISIPTPKEAS